MYLSRRARVALRVVTWLVLVALYFPLLLVMRLSIATSRGFTWPPSGFTLEHWSDAAHADGPRAALWNSLTIAAGATLVALVLGSLAAAALTRYRFFGRDVISLMLVLPLALPGIVTGIAFNSGFARLGVDLSRATLITAHATFCIVIVFNNVAARMRQLSPNLEEASADLGADQLHTFLHVRLPLLASSLLAGGLLAFALSFDEIIVTTFTAAGGFQTLPLWIFQNMFRDTSLPLVNVTATFVVLVMVLPVYLAQRLTDVAAGGRT
ncbi:MAG: ydcV 5 [Acidimicrobiales bacterium]|nr:ydcV 5 [Acidimicrobiales bacterium]